MFGGDSSSNVGLRLHRVARPKVWWTASAMPVAFLVFTAWPRLTYAQATSVPTEDPRAVSSEDPRAASESASIPTVEIRVVGSSERRQAVEAVLGVQRAGRVRFEWASATRFDPRQLFELADASRAKIRCWIDLSDSNAAHLYFVDPRLDRYMLRDLPLHHRFGSFEIESLAQVFELSIDALLTNAEVGLSRVEAAAILTPAKPPKPSPVLPRQPTASPRAAPYLHSVAVSARYELLRYSDEIPVQHGFGLSLAREFEGRTGVLQGAFAGAYFWPSHLTNQVASATIRGASLSLQLAQLWSIDQVRRQYLGLGLTGGLFWLGAKAAAGDLPGEYVVQQHEARTIEAFVGPVGLWRVNLARHLSLQLACSLALYPSPIRHEFVVDGRIEPVTTGASIRPGLNLGVVFR